VAHSGNPFRQSIRVQTLFVRSQFIIAGIEMILYAVGFAIARVPWWPLFAVVGGFCSFIPGVGSLIFLALISIALLFTHRDWTSFAVTFGVWLSVQALEGFVLQPVLLGKPLGLRALPVFLALIAGSLLFGPLGFILAVPVLAVANVFWRYFSDKQAERSPRKQRARQ
jgi:predicted PurR-regulated permease PerM